MKVGMYAQLEFEHAGETILALYRDKKHFASGEPALTWIKLTNEDLTELVVINKIKPVEGQR